MPSKKFKRDVWRYVLSTALIACALNARAEDSDEASWDVRFNPLGALFAQYEMEWNIRVQDNLTVGSMYTHWEFEDDKRRAAFGINAYGMRANWHLNKAFSDGAYISAYFVRQNTALSGTGTVTKVGTSTEYSSRFSGQEVDNVLGFIVGYQWNWHFFNLNLGVGHKTFKLVSMQATDSNGNKVTPPDAGTAKGIGPFSMDMMLGIAF